MSEKKRPDDFENRWQGKLARAVEELAGAEIRMKVLAGGESLRDESPSREKADWTRGALGRLAESADLPTRQEILTRCHCAYPVEDLQDVKALYQRTGDIDQVLDALQAKFEAFLREVLELEEGLVEEVIQRGWGLAGARAGNTILATKIPKSGFLRDYFQTDDPLEKRRLYCHCPRVRDQVGAETPLPPEYCCCGAGFYRGIWEEILGAPVKVEVLESVLSGGDVCRIAVRIQH